MGNVKRLPKTINGNIVYALARRDGANFDRWLAEMSRDDEAQETLFDVYFLVFREMVELCFPPEVDVREIVRFAAEPRVRPFPKLDLPLLETEALIRSARGERGLVGGIALETIMRIRVQMIVHLTEALGLSDAELLDIIERAERHAMIRLHQS